MKTLLLSSEEVARSVAESRFKKINRKTLKFSLDVGDPTITADSPIQLETIREEFFGDYVVESVVHSIKNNGYTSALELEKNIGDA